MERLLTRMEFRTRRRRATRLNFTILIISLLPLLVLVLLPDLLGRKVAFESLPGKLGAIPYMVGLLWLFGGIAYANAAWRRVGLICPSCRKDFRQNAQLDVAMASGRCGNCGSKVLADDA
jgi:DNA-directed RNA polymerase subunit RPC12/RpoP